MNFLKRLPARVFGFKAFAWSLFVVANFMFFFGVYISNEYHDSKAISGVREFFNLRKIANEDNVKNAIDLERSKSKIRQLKRETKGLKDEIKYNPVCSINYHAERLYNLSTAGTSKSTPSPGQDTATVARITQGQQIEHSRLNGLDYQSLLKDYYSLKRHYEMNCLQIKTD